MQILYRKLKPSEAADFRRVRLECLQKFPDNFGTLYEDEIVKPKLYFEGLIEQNSPDAFFFGAFDEADLIGIAGFVRGERTKTRHRGEIVAMYVSPDHRGRQIGTRLLCALIEAAFETDGIEQIHLTVVADNASAVGLYERIGFKIFGVQESYFKLGEKRWDQNFMQLQKKDFSGKINIHENLDES